MTQTELCLEPRCKVPDRGTDCYELLMAFQRGESLTTFEAFAKLGITTISQRCGDLRRKYGWSIQSKFVETNGGAVVKRYWMERP